MKPPLAERLRPSSLSEVVGQDHLVGKEGFLTRLVAAQTPLSILLWGPPGCGKTTIARLYAKAFGMRFVTMSAVFSTVSDLRKVVQDAEQHPLEDTLLFVDEIHRFNKAQQDAFLPYVEKGSLLLIGATTENPSFSLNNALLSRLRVLNVHPLGTGDLLRLLAFYEEKVHPLPLKEESKRLLADFAKGDGRYLYNLIENLPYKPAAPLSPEELAKALQARAPLFDRNGEQHYNLISTLHKAVRGSDPDAALYWLYRILAGGEDPLFLCRRIIRMASEDVGLADPGALAQALQAQEAYQRLGSPEGELALAQAVVYIALAPKSNALYVASKEARQAAQETSHLSPPLFSLNAPTRLMKESGYGKGYVYDHDTEAGCAGHNYFPPGMPRRQFYHPAERGFEREMRKRLAYFEDLRKREE